MRGGWGPPNEMPHVLVVDDSHTVQHGVSSLLQRYGFRTTSASSAEEGLAVVREERPDLVLMDVVFPGMSGYHATRRLMRDPATSAIPVVLMSVRSGEADREWGLRQGARDYLVKPFRAGDLVSTVRRTLSQSE